MLVELTRRLNGGQPLYDSNGKETLSEKAQKRLRKAVTRIYDSFDTNRDDHVSGEDQGVNAWRMRPRRPSSPRVWI